MTRERGNGRGLSERSQEHVIGRVLRDTTDCTESTCHLTDLWIERVHDDTDLGKSIPDDRGDRKAIRTGQDLVDHQNLG